MLYRNLELHNIQAVFPAEDGEGVRLSRLPEPLRGQVNEGCKGCCLHAAGAELRFNLEPGQSLRLVCRTEPTKFEWERGGLLEVLHGPFHASWHMVGFEPTEIRVSAPPARPVLERIARQVKAPFDPGLTRIVLPYRPSFRLLELDGGPWSPPRPEQVPARRLLIYGTSITHGAWSVRPTETYAMQLARRLGMDLVNLGFGGAAHYEPAIADHIAGRGDWDAVLLESHNLVNLEPAVFQERVAYYLRTIRQAHPDKPVFCTSLFMASELFPKLLANAGSRRALARAMKRAVEASGLPGVRYIPTRTVFRDPCGLNADLVHPSPSGMAEIAERLARAMRPACA